MSDRPKPQRGDIWVHYKGGTYVVLCVAIDANNRQARELDLGTLSLKDESVVVYRKINTEEIYVRSEAEFLEEVTEGLPRFRLDHRAGGFESP